MTAALATQSDTESRLLRAASGEAGEHWEWSIAEQSVWLEPSLCRQLEGPWPGVASLGEFLELVHPQDRELVRGLLEGCGQSGGRFDQDFRLRTSDGGYRWFQASAAATRCLAGESVPTHVSGSLRDVTEQHRISEQLRDNELQLAQRDRMEALDCLAGGIAHEFNNILQATRGYVSFALDEQQEGSQSWDDLRKALEVSDRATEITRSLLDFARAQEASHDSYQVADELQGFRTLLRPVIGEHIAFKTQVTDQPMTCSADLQGLRQSLLNLCINSRDAMPDGGRLTITAEPFVVDQLTGPLLPVLGAGSYCRVRVADDGSGIAPGSVDQVFNPFFSTKEVGRGTGLGLATVHGFAQRNGGHVEVYSEEARGTVFSIYLPVEEELEMPNEVMQPELADRDLPLVLLVEDDPRVREVGRRILESSGCRVIEAADGESALELYVEHVHEVALVVLDVVLPRLSGRKVFEEIRRLQSEVPVVFTTGFDPASPAGKEDGQLANHTLAKPYDRRQLVEVLDALKIRRPMTPVA